jgi:hypothetical protein
MFGSFPTRRIDTPYVKFTAFLRNGNRLGNGTGKTVSFHHQPEGWFRGGECQFECSSLTRYGVDFGSAIE